jgi:hypothetical protein
MTGSSVFSALALARTLVGPGREPGRVPEPEFRPMFPPRPSADVRVLDAEPDATRVGAELPSGKAA